MRRREFLAALSSAAAATSPFAARAQERMRRIGILPAAARPFGDQTRVGAFLQALALLGWSVGRNVRIDTRWATTNHAERTGHAEELVALAPDVILASVRPRWGRCCRRPAPCQLCSRSSLIQSVPASSKAWRGRAATPRVLYRTNTASPENGWSCSKRSAARDASGRPSGRRYIRIGQFGAIQSVAPSFGVELSPVNGLDAAEIERAITAFARSPNGCLIVTAGPSATVIVS